MLSGHSIICFSNDWRQDPLSKHHIMSRLSRSNRILWINSIGLRTPTMTASDARRIVSKLCGFFAGLRHINDNLYVVSPIAIPFQSPLFMAINTLLLKAQIRRYQWKFGLKNPLFWTFLPNTARFAHAFGEKLSIYYITDDFTKFDGHPSQALEAMEAQLIDTCDCIIASATELARKKQRGGKTVHIVNHGVNHSHFARALNLQSKDIPLDIKNLPRPILGFYGELNTWINLPLIAEAAQKRPGWTFAIIGRTAVEVGNIDYLKHIPNVRLLGQKQYDDLPAYCAAFDVALIPMKINDLTICVNPLKLREYLAAGVPVIAAPLPEIQPYADVVKFAQTADELIAAFEEIQADPRWKDKKALSRRVANESWDARVEEISAIIEAALERKESHQQQETQRELRRKEN